MLHEPSDNANVVFTAKRLAEQIGFTETQQPLIATAASELSTNIIRYAGKGMLTLRILWNENREGMEIVAQDKGPGIANIEKAMRENFSTGNGLGLGLPSVKRIMDEFEIQSKSGHGTYIVARKWK